jgi:hypothetical protein
MHGQRHLSDELVSQMLSELKKHFGEPVRPVSEYCQAFYDWQKLITEQANLELDDEHNDFHSSYQKEIWEKVSKGLSDAYIAIVKSNYLWRRIYGDGLHRTVKCPEHQGTWSGYGWGEESCPHGCMHGYDQTGWLPDPHEFVKPPADVPPEFDKDGKVTKMGVTYMQTRCYQCAGVPEAEIHG